jgi:hypothetical protein
MAPVLGLVAVALLQFFVHMLVNTSGTSGTTTLNVLSVVIGVIAFIAIIPVALYWYYMYCKAAEVVTKQDLSFGLSYGSLIVLNFFSVGFLWPFIVQYYFNKVAEGNAPAATAPAAA